MPKAFVQAQDRALLFHSNLGRATPAGSSRAFEAGAASGLARRAGQAAALLPPATHPGVYTHRGGLSSTPHGARACLSAGARRVSRACQARDCRRRHAPLWPARQAALWHAGEQKRAVLQPEHSCSGRLASDAPASSPHLRVHGALVGAARAAALMWPAGSGRTPTTSSPRAGARAWPGAGRPGWDPAGPLRRCPARARPRSARGRPPRRSPRTGTRRCPRAVAGTRSRSAGRPGARPPQHQRDGAGLHALRAGRCGQGGRSARADLRHKRCGPAQHVAQVPVTSAATASRSGGSCASTQRCARRAAAPSAPARASAAASALSDSISIPRLASAAMTCRCAPVLHAAYALPELGAGVESIAKGTPAQAARFRGGRQALAGAQACTRRTCCHGQRSSSGQRAALGRREQAGLRGPGARTVLGQPAQCVHDKGHQARARRHDRPALFGVVGRREAAAHGLRRDPLSGPPGHFTAGPDGRRDAAPSPAQRQ
jgi:hypothetical protein